MRATIPPSLAFFVLLSLASWSVDANAQDIRDKVAAPPEAGSMSGLIDPDSSIYGIPFGTTEDQFITQFGRPTGYLRLAAGMTGMIYGKTHCFLFAGGQLAGVRI